MHRALKVPEIVAMICQEIQLISKVCTGRNASATLANLAAVARTCKAFSGPALDLLWANQQTVLHVLRCMPDDVWTEQDSDDDEEEEGMGLARPVLPTDWERPLVYSHRVKSFNLDGPYSSVEPGFLEELRMCFPGEYLFPNLERLEWFSKNPSFLPHARLFLGRRLKFLSLGTFTSAAHFSLLPSLAAQCPSLLDVDIYASDELQPQSQTAVSLFVGGLTRLETLIVPSLDRAALEHLGRLPNFTCLTLQAQLPLPLPDSPIPPNQALFTSLECLAITGTDISDIFDLLSHSPIDNIDASFPTSTTASAITKCYSALASACAHSPLSSLALGEANRLFSEPDPTQATAAQIAISLVHGRQLRPLFVLANLRTVSLSTPVGFDLDNATVSELAHAWPHLETLQFGASDFVHVPSRVTLAGLLPFAKHCSLLRTLEIPLDASVVPAWADQTTRQKRIAQKRLTELRVQRSPIFAPLAVAGFLSSVFPTLRSVCTDREYRTNTAEHQEALVLHRKWKDVESALPLLHTVRAEERYWTQRGKK
ncbi:hypothetical protein DFH09DRAFT_981276 [Mycena vulgaris]|nr:hypothetical protein DFH09DRAFT_981276 [Mycena vulgaris]